MQCYEEKYTIAIHSTIFFIRKMEKKTSVEGNDKILNSSPNLSILGEFP